MSKVMICFNVFLDVVKQRKDDAGGSTPTEKSAWLTKKASTLITSEFVKNRKREIFRVSYM